MKEVSSAKQEPDREELHQLFNEGLEAARLEVVARLAQLRLPTSLPMSRLTVIDNEMKTGWHSDWVTVSASSLNRIEVMFAIRDADASGVMLTFRDQMSALANLLDRTSDLATRPHVWMPGLAGAEAILLRYLAPLAQYYVETIADVAVPNPEVVARLRSELDELVAAQDHWAQVTQLALGGVVPDETYDYRDVAMRRLTEEERGAAWESRSGEWDHSRLPGSDFIPPRSLSSFLPVTLVEARASVPQSPVMTLTPSNLIYRLALAFFLKGYEISSSGGIVVLQRPLWSKMGTSYSPFAVSEKVSTAVRTLSESDCRSIVDLAYKIPEFTASEGSGREIVLYRALRGFGMHWQESGFLDHAIALEAALLKNTTSEVAYRFSLYGAVFLRDRRDPRDTFDRLRNIYDLRSRLVHGSRMNTAHRKTAESDARELLRAVVLKAVETGWPEAEALDAEALGVQQLLGAV